MAIETMLVGFVAIMLILAIVAKAWERHERRLLDQPLDQTKRKIFIRKRRR